MKLPAIQFYPADWRKDPGVQSLDYFDKGVWFEILCLMHESPERGKLLLNGVAMPDAALARILGLDNQTLTKTLTTLLDYGVASRDPESGALMNRRMVKDEGVRKVRTEAGKKGGNPVLLNQKSTTLVNQIPTTGVKQIPTPSSSSSSSSSITTSTTKEKKEEVRTAEPRLPSNKPKQCEENFLAELQVNEAYQKLNVKQVNAKMVAWCSVNGKVATRRRLINWLNREDQPLENGNGQHGTNKPGASQTASERGDAKLRRYVEIEQELRGESGGTIN